MAKMEKLKKNRCFFCSVHDQRYVCHCFFQYFFVVMCLLKISKKVASSRIRLLIAGASSYSRYDKGIEIEIDTREDHRRKGLAYVCGAKLILECLEEGLYPSWDAQNKWSVALAEKLGYHFSHEYVAYEIMGY